MSEIIDNNSWMQRYADFDGGVEALASALATLRPQLSWEDQSDLNLVRLIRYYQAQKALDAPERRGKEAFYGFRQLVQFVAARWLLKDGWPLAKAAAETMSRPTDELIALVASPHDDSESRPSALELVRGFQAASTVNESPQSRPIAKDIASRQLALSARLGSAARSSAPLEAGGQPVAPRETLRLDLADWCSVTVDQDKADALTEEQARAVAEALYRALVDARASRAAAKKRRS